MLYRLSEQLGIDLRDHAAWWGIDFATDETQATFLAEIANIPGIQQPNPALSDIQVTPEECP